MIGTIMRGITGLGAIAKPITQVVEVFKPNAEKQAQRDNSALSAAYAQFAAEFRKNRTWWDSLVDGLNRLPRPIIVGGVIYYFYLAIAQPVQFHAINLALASIPDPMWFISSGVIGFYFSMRSVEKVKFDRNKFEMVSQAMKMQESQPKPEPVPEPTKHHPGDIE